MSRSTKFVNPFEPVINSYIQLQRAKLGEIPLNILNTMDALYKDKENRPLLIKDGVSKSESNWNFIFTLNPGCDYKELESKLSYFQSVVSGTVEIKRKDEKYAHINVNNYKFDKNYPFNPQYIQELIFTKDNYKKMDIPIIIGINSNGKLLIIDIVDIPHILVAGINKSGKSNWIKQLLWGVKLVRPNTIIFYLDFKGADAWSIEPIGFSTTEIEEARYFLSAIKQEVIKRNQFLKQKRMSKIHSIKEIPRILIGIDEITEMNDKQCQEDLFYLLRMSRNTATNIIAGTQKPSHKTYKDFCESRSQFEARMCFRLAEPKDSHLVLNSDKAYTHIKPNTGGRGIWQFGEDEVIQSLYISDGDIYKFMHDLNLNKGGSIIREYKQNLWTLPR